jgi:predicted HicB family RNase H-like nuclease
MDMTPPPRRNDNLCFRIEAGLRAELAAAAAAEGRSLSWLAHKILADWVRRRQGQRKS